VITKVLMTTMTKHELHFNTAFYINLGYLGQSLAPFFFLYLFSKRILISGTFYGPAAPAFCQLTNSVKALKEIKKNWLAARENHSLGSSCFSSTASLMK